MVDELKWAELGGLCSGKPPPDSVIHPRREDYTVKYFMSSYNV